MRLIDAEKLEQDLRKDAARILAGDDYGKDRQRLARGLIRAADICRAAETVDAVEHGEWIEEPVPVDTDDESVELVRLRCSACMREAYIAGKTGPRMHYCPCCGAKMEKQE